MQNNLAQQDQTVAIIVPFYNVAAYLARCLESIVTQTHRNLEVILIDDGSTDASGLIADAYSARYAFIQVIHQENSGQGQARNVGLAASTAPFVCFVDSDDIIDARYVEELLCALLEQQADIAISSYVTILQRGARIYPLGHMLLPRSLSGKSAFRRVLRDASIKNYLWNKLFKRRLFDEPTPIRFPSICYEDIAALPRVFARASRVAVTRRVLYRYCRREDSLLTTLTPRNVQENIQALRMVRDFLKQQNLLDEYGPDYKYLTTKFSLYIAFMTFRTHRAQGRGDLLKSAIASFKQTLYLMNAQEDDLKHLPQL